MFRLFVKMEDVKKILDKASPFIVVPRGKIDKSNPVVIEFIAFYEKVTGKKTGQGTCRDCILDAFFELKRMSETQLNILTMDRKFLLKKGKLVFWNNNHYTNANMTDAIAFAMIDSNRRNAAPFENPDALLAAYDASKGEAVKVQTTTKQEGGKTVSITTKEPEKKEAPKEEPKKETPKVIEKGKPGRPRK